MDRPAPDAWIEEPPTDLPPPEPAPADWAPPTPVEARIEPAPGVAVEEEEQELARLRHGRTRRFWITTAVYGALWLGAVLFIHTGQSPLSPLLFLVPLYLLTLPFVLRTPKRLRGRKRRWAERLEFQAKLMTSVAIFLAVYLPFTIFSGQIIPFASLVEYVLFTLLLLVLLRLGGRSIGVAPSVDALPPPSHRLHQQVVAPIDDAHYQRTLWLNYSFVEKGRGARHLAKRLDEILEGNGVSHERRAQLLSELDAYHDEGGLRRGRSRRERRADDRARRAQVLDRLFGALNQELETRA